MNARAEQRSREETYRIFLTESLRMLPQGKWFTKSYIESLKPEKVETRTGKEVADEAAKKIGFNIDWGR